MANDHNLIPISSRTPAERQEIARKGGKTVSIYQKVNKMRLCRPKCPIYDKCWARPIKVLDDKGRKRCALNTMTERIKRRTVRLLQDGEEGFNAEIIEMLTRLSVDLDLQNDPKAKERALYQLRECKKAIFGDKQTHKFEGIQDVHVHIAPPSHMLEPEIINPEETEGNIHEKENRPARSEGEHDQD